jgi:hypothetical protein
MAAHSEGLAESSADLDWKRYAPVRDGLELIGMGIARSANGVDEHWVALHGS